VALGGLGASTGMLVGFGVGRAAGAALEPAFEVPRQDAWTRNPNRILSAETLARLVVEGGIPLEAAQNEALRDGYGPSRVAALAYLEQRVPDVAFALELWRRGLLGDDAFSHVLVKSGLDQRYHEPIIRSKTSRRLDPAVVALAIVRGLIADPGILPVGPPAGEGKVPRFPVFNVDAELEAEAAGYDLERLSVMVGNMGRPASADQAARAMWRGAIERVDFDRAIAEGDVRNEWRDAILESFRPIPSPTEAAELRVRGWLDEQAAAELAARSGMTPDDLELLWKLHGRPIALHEVVIGLRRGGAYPGSYGNVPEPFRTALRESSIREEWCELAYAARFTYPSAFVIRSLVETGALTAADAEGLFLELGWKPALATKVSKALAKAAGGASKAETKAELLDEYAGGFVTEQELRAALGDLGYAGHELDLEVHLGDARRVKRYREKVVDAIAAAFVTFRLDENAANAELAAAGVTGEAASSLLALWTLQRKDTIRNLTPAQIRKAFTAGLIPRETALTELEWQHYTAADAATFLDE
jgi:hypothetical protein